MTLREDIVKAARRQVGARFRHQARLPGKALDCLGVLSVTAAEVGIKVRDYTQYPRRPNGSFLEFFKRAGMVEIPVGTEQPGDVLVFSEYPYFEPWHAAILVEDGVMVHAKLIYRLVKEHRFTEAWKKVQSHAFKFPGVE